MPDLNLGSGFVYLAAAHYSNLNYPVIPLLSDGDRVKTPAIRWSEFQHHLPTDEDLLAWFGDSQYQALGIVTGEISHLAVLDFDDPDLYVRFQKRFPWLYKTRQVKTRRGRHLYFQIDKNHSTRSIKGAGLDWLYNGHYVVAPPSTINGFVYQIIQGGSPRKLRSDEICQIEAFVDATRPLSPVHTTETQESRFSSDSRASSQPISSLDITGMYRYAAYPGNRNNALFQASCFARDHGWSQSQTQSLLQSLHADNQHPDEKTSCRQREAQKTIASAYSRPARKIRFNPGLPNTAREQLFQIGLTCVVRVIEGLRSKGIRSGQHLTEGDIRELLDGIVGRHSIRQTLTATLPDGTYIIQRTPLPGPHTAEKTAADTDQNTQQKNALLTSTKPKLIRRGRKTMLYQMPSDKALCELLGVEMTGISDPLTQQDLQSAKRTRDALHRGLIQRRPGLYSTHFLAERLGVSTRTLQRYNAEDPDLHVIPMYLDEIITWQTLQYIPDEPLRGTFLTDSDGKRYPPLRGIARRLLSKRQMVTLRRRGWNYYYYGDNAPDLSILLGMNQERMPQNRPKTAFSGARPTRLGQPAAKPHPDALNAFAGKVSDMPLSQPVAQQLVETYGIERVNNALKRVQARKGVRNPAGLLITMLRSEGRGATHKENSP